MGEAGDCSRSQRCPGWLLRLVTCGDREGSEVHDELWRGSGCVGEGRSQCQWRLEWWQMVFRTTAVECSRRPRANRRTCALLRVPLSPVNCVRIREVTASRPAFRTTLRATPRLTHKRSTDELWPVLTIANWAVCRGRGSRAERTGSKPAIRLQCIGMCASGLHAHKRWGRGAHNSTRYSCTLNVLVLSPSTALPYLATLLTSVQLYKVQECTLRV